MAVCYSGDLDHVDEALAPIRALDEPVVDLLGEQPYAQVQCYRVLDLDGTRRGQWDKGKVGRCRARLVRKC
jgi:hypothetical protein